MKVALVDEAIELLEKANAELEPELLAAPDARALLDAYARAERLAAYGVAALARKVDDPTEVARATGTSMGKAKAVVTTGKMLGTSDDLGAALQHGDISLDQASEIAKAEESSPGAAQELIGVAQNQGFHVLRDRARRIKLEAEQHRDLGRRQRAARFARVGKGDLGMIDVHLRLQPHIGTPIVDRAEAEANRLYRAARKDGAAEPFERHLADAFAALMTGNGKGHSKRPELVVLVSHEVATRGWRDVRPGEHCKIPGVGPIPPEVAWEIGKDAFLSGVFYDGVDLRNLKRWTRNIPIEVRIALELGEPPDFDGIACTDCGKRFRPENDHVEPHVGGGPASVGNTKPRCWDCHRTKTERDRKAGKLKPPDP